MIEPVESVQMSFDCQRFDQGTSVIGKRGIIDVSQSIPNPLRYRRPSMKCDHKQPVPTITAALIQAATQTTFTEANTVCRSSGFSAFPRYGLNEGFPP